MKTVLTLSVLLLCLLCIKVSEGRKRVMPWMCLERCNDTAEQIEAQMETIHSNLHLISGVSFEVFNLGPHSQLLRNNFTNVGDRLRNWGLETFPMISSFPYPPDFIDWLRQLFKQPHPFISAAVQQAKIRGYSGFNVDFEPTAHATPEDATNYANFLTEFAHALHQIGCNLTVDVATWNPLWDFNLISQSAVDRIFTMSTYTSNLTSFETQIALAVQKIDLNKLGIGLETDNAKYDHAALQARFSLIKKYGVQEIDLWRMTGNGLPDVWWPFIEQFVG